MGSSIPHPTSTSFSTFGGPRTTENKKYMKKRSVEINITFFHVFLVFHCEGPPKECQVGTRWIWNLIPHAMSDPNQI
jgi:hypothetical protein